MIKSNGLLVIVSGPSGVGKGTIIKLLRERLKGAKFLLSQTTREMRPGEKDGETYHFVSEKEFKKGIEEGLFLEWAQVHEEDYYGVLKSSLQGYLDSGELAIREVDVQGAESIRKVVPKDQLLTIFIKPENMSVLHTRIEHRGKLPADELKRRFESTEREMLEASKFDYQIINYENRIESCYMDVEDLIKSRAEHQGIMLEGGGGTLL
jgi:guanylate kinase